MSSSNFRCYYCEFEYVHLCQCTEHLKLVHGCLELKYRKRILDEKSGKFVYQSVHHPGIIPDKLQEEDKCLKVVGDKLYIERGHSKRQRIDSSLLEKSSITKDDFINSVTKLLPALYDNLQKEEQVEAIETFLCLVSRGIFPLRNIAYILFLDVVNWYSLDTTTHMRYQPTSMNFWKVGYRLFHGKFLRFMSGEKSMGHLIENPDDKGCIDPSYSCINFAVPSRQNLYRDEEPAQSESFCPGIFQQTIRNISEHMGNNAIKLAVDGKKISRGKGITMGDIDCWGHEGKPSLQEKKAEHDKQVAYLSSMLENLVQSDPNEILQGSYQSHTLLSALQKTVQYIADRQKTLRAVSHALTGTESKILKMAGDNWRKSKFFPLIASLRVNKMDVNQNISDGLQLSKKISILGAEVNGVGNLSSDGNSVILSKQDNYIPIVHPTQDDTRKVKQGSEEWQQLRQKAKVTGSTCNRAVGLSKLKDQAAHYDRVILGKQEQQGFSDREIQAMRYGKEHEIDAVATLCGTILPFYYPHLRYVEEGCMTIGHNGDSNFMVVSPDGSLRTSWGSTPEVMFETKCKSPTGYVKNSYHTIPSYYVPQILSEMAAYSCDELLFTCWSEESTTVFHVQFDEEIWSTIWKELVCMYGTETASRPKRFSPTLGPLREEINRYLERNTELIAEFPSSVKIEGNDGGVSTSTHIETELIARSRQRRIVDKIEEVINATMKWMAVAYHLSRTVATEILVYMISDLDRRYHAEISNSHLIAYAMKGSSMRGDTFRAMMNDAIHACETAGLRVLVTASDGQWHRYGIRDDNDRPLTIIQLQKDHWNATKKQPLPAIKSKLSNICRVTTDEVRVTKEIGKGIVVENSVYTSILNIFSNGDFLLSRAMCNLAENDEQNNKQSQNELASSSVPSTNDDATIDGNVNDDAEECGLDFLCTSNDATFHGVLNAYTNSTELIDIDNTTVVGQDAMQQESTTGSIEEALDIFYRQDTSDVQRPDQLVEQTPSIACNSALDEESCTIGTSRKFELMKTTLAASMLPKHKVWEGMSLQNFADCFSSLKRIENSFTKPELCASLSSVQGEGTQGNITWRKSWKKGKLAETLWGILRGKPPLRNSTRKASPPSLRKLCMRSFEKLRKTELATILATLSWHDELSRWMNSSKYPSGISIAGITDSIVWFSQPNMASGEVRFHFTDACHVLTCLRTKLCTSGIDGLDKNAWKEAALSPDTSLNIALVTDCLDKQSVSIARRVFALDVQKYLEQTGKYNKEAQFCALIRDWFDSIDEPKLAAAERIRRRLALRDWLLEGYTIGNFPPQTQYVKGIPIVTFEALVVHIERSIQIYPFLHNSYNPRTLGSQEVEQFFSTFKDMDPSGSGTPKPDAIPGMLRAAVELDNFRLDPDRYVVKNLCFLSPRQDMFIQYMSYSPTMTYFMYLIYVRWKDKIQCKYM